MKCHPFLIGSILAVGVSVSAAQAQEAPGGIRFAGATADVGLSGAATYDSNVSRSSAQVASTRDLKPSDVYFTPSVTLNVVKMFGLQTASLTGAAGYDFYDRNHKLDRERISLIGQLAGAIGPCQEKLSATYSRYQSDLQDLVTTTIQNVSDTKQAELKVNCGHDFGIAPTASVSEQWSDNSAALMLTSDYRTFVASGGLAYQTPALGQISLYGEYAKTDYPNRRIVVGATTEADGLDVTSGGLRFEHQIGARIDGVVTASYSSTSFRVPGERPFSGLTYSADVNYTASDRLRFHVKFLRGPTATMRLGANQAVQKTYGGDIRYALGSVITLAAGGSINDQNFQSSPGTPVNPIPVNPLTNERIKSVFSSVTFNLGRGVAFSVAGQHDQRDSNDAAYNYASSRVTATLQAKF